MTGTAEQRALAAAERRHRLTALEGAAAWARDALSPAASGLGAGEPAAPHRPAGPWWLVLVCGLVRQAAQATEADRGRAALLATVSHDLRAPLAAAKAAVSGLRSRDARLTADDHAELLATAEESLDLLAHLVASLLDVSRLQAGALAVFPRPSELGEIVADALDALGPRARTVRADIPSGLCEVMADPAIVERVIANLVGNALRYSPASPPRVTARALGDRVELRVVDHGTGIPEADRRRAFLPFHRLGRPDDGTGVGLGLAVSRGLLEIMDGTVEPHETPGGGLTMVVSLPAAPARPAAEVGARPVRAA
jgi:two-component system, OmpR family, sensor histidine kinase KdpD